ncbi:MAG: hypothetical protein EXQ60_00285 [Candidatus Nanopelagicales bacterium]|nr:hypothetical protein [Candidatus Nanopelagicales bacterium]
MTITILNSFFGVAVLILSAAGLVVVFDHHDVAAVQRQMLPHPENVRRSEAHSQHPEPSAAQPSTSTGSRRSRQPAAQNTWIPRPGESHFSGPRPAANRPG